MLLNAKIGTMQGTLVYVRYKRKPPQAGDRLEVRDALEPGSRWRPVLVDKVETCPLCGQFYYLDRM